MYAAKKVSTTWRLSPALSNQFTPWTPLAAAQVFEKGKEKLGGVHFLALQQTPDSGTVEGFFLLRERKK
jgi:hypothetical protein